MRETARNKQNRKAKQREIEWRGGGTIEAIEKLLPFTREIREEEEQPLLCSPPFSLLFVFQSPPLFCLSFESPANSVSVCCMLPWLFLEPDALCYLPVRPTNSGCSVCVCYCICGWVFFVHMKQKITLEKLRGDSDFFCLVVCFIFFNHPNFSLRLPAASWRL